MLIYLNIKGKKRRGGAFLCLQNYCMVEKEKRNHDCIVCFFGIIKTTILNLNISCCKIQEKKKTAKFPPLWQKKTEELIDQYLQTKICYESRALKKIESVSSLSPMHTTQNIFLSNGKKNCFYKYFNCLKKCIIFLFLFFNSIYYTP